MKLWLPVFLICCCLVASAQKNAQQKYFRQIGWTVSVPDDMHHLAKDSVRQLKEKGRKTLEATQDAAIDISSTMDLLNIKTGRFDYLESSITPFNPRVDGDWKTHNRQLNQMLTGAFVQQIPGLVVDTASTNKVIGGLSFDEFDAVLTYPNGIVLNIRMFSRLIGGYDFGITISFENPEAGRRFMQLIESSHFGTLKN